MTGTEALPGDREHLEAERDFLLTSLADLDEEHAAGDLDDGDHARLRDDYTARAAAVLRALDALDARAVREARRGRRRAGVDGEGRPEVAEARTEERRTLWRWAAVVVVIAGLAGVLVVQAAGDRGSGGISGEIRASSNQLLADARDAFAGGDADRALALYDEVLAQSPTNLEALTYKAWVGRNSGELDDAEALELLDEALGISPGYPDAGVFRAVVLERLGRSAEAAEQLRSVDGAAIPEYMVEMVTTFGVSVAGSLSQAGDPAGANEVLDHVLELDPEHLPALVTKGALLSAVAQVAEGDDRARIAERSLATMDRAVAVAEDRPEELPAALLARAEVRARLGDVAGAVADADRVEDLGVPDELADRLAALRASLTAA